MNEKLKDSLEAALEDADIRPEELPRIDLYMDQILTLFDEGLARNKRFPQEKLLTKTMVNNYSKERLILPVKGKKYTREQVMQLLCVLNLKQTLALGDVKQLMGVQGQISYEKVYSRSLALKGPVRRELRRLVAALLEPEPEGFSDGEELLATALALSSAAFYLRRICEKLVDSEFDDQA